MTLWITSKASYSQIPKNGTITRVDSSEPDLFFALKGGLNRFGVVTSAEFYTHEQPDQVYVSLLSSPKEFYHTKLC